MRWTYGGFRKLVLEGDNIVAINALNSEDEDLFFGGVIVADIKRMAQSCRRISLCFAKRGENRTCS